MKILFRIGLVVCCVIIAIGLAFPYKQSSQKDNSGSASKNPRIVKAERDKIRIEAEENAKSRRYGGQVGLLMALFPGQRDEERAGSNWKGPRPNKDCYYILNLVRVFQKIEGGYLIETLPWPEGPEDSEPAYLQTNISYPENKIFCEFDGSILNVRFIGYYKYIATDGFPHKVMAFKIYNGNILKPSVKVKHGKK